MLTAAYYMLRDGVEYHDLGPQHLARRDTERTTQRLPQRLRDLGVVVEVQDAWFAALAIESGCEWVTTDRDFARFPGLNRREPL